MDQRGGLPPLAAAASFGFLRRPFPPTGCVFPALEMDLRRKEKHKRAPNFLKILEARSECLCAARGGGRSEARCPPPERPQQPEPFPDRWSSHSPRRAARHRAGLEWKPTSGGSGRAGGRSTKLGLRAPRKRRITSGRGDVCCVWLYNYPDVGQNEKE